MATARKYVASTMHAICGRPAVINRSHSQNTTVISLVLHNVTCKQIL